MKRSYLILLALGGCWLAGKAWGRPVDLSAPSSQVGSSDINGDLQIWREIDGAGLDMGPGSYLPLRYGFSSAATTWGILGPGFRCPMFEAKNILIREQMMRAFLPCGKGLYLRRDTVDPNKFATLDQEWTGYLNGDDFTVWRDDGWTMLYHKGQLSSITTDQNHVFTWSYGTGNLASVSRDGQAVITVEPNAAGQAAALMVGAQRYTVDYAPRPILEELQGQTAVKELDPALSSFTYPNGSKDTFKFGLTPGRVPTLTVTMADQQATDYSWDAASGHLATEKGAEGNWTYEVGDLLDGSSVPPIFRTNAQGKTEGMAIDTQAGTYTATHLDGSTVISHVFETPGPLYMKVREVNRLLPNGQSTTLYKVSYDEFGRVIRSVDAKGFATTYTYNSNSSLIKRVITIPSDPEILRELQKREAALLKMVITAPTIRKKEGILEKLAFFYIHDRGLPEKALALLPQLTNRNLAFNVQLHAIDGNITLTGLQKAEQFQILEKQYPEETKLLDLLIKVRPQEDHLEAITSN